jgi:hypothetical protein
VLAKGENAVGRIRKSKLIVPAATLTILVLGAISGRHALGSLPPSSPSDDGIDIAVVSSDPTVAMGITVDVTPESWVIFINPVALSPEVLPKNLTAALIVSQGWHLRGIDNGYRQNNR